MELATSDQAAAKTFYGKLFGWSFRDNPMGPDSFYTMFQLDGRDASAAYQLDAKQLERAVPPHWNLYIATSDANATAASAKENGGNVIMAPFDVFDSGRMAVIQDPTGAIFSIWQPVKQTGIGIAGVNNAFCWADLNTTDPQKASAFYSAVFGWEIRAGEKDPSGYLHINNGKDAIGGIPPVRPGPPPHWMIYYQVDDCDAATSKANNLGGRTYRQPTTIETVGRMSVVADPQGAVFALFAP